MSKWTLDDGRVLTLLTPEELERLPDGTALVDVMGLEVVKGRDKIDGDTRYGYLAYGVLDGAPSGETPRCGLCGEPMPPGEEMFKYHGHSGPCPESPPWREGLAAGFAETARQLYGLPALPLEIDRLIDDYTARLRGVERELDSRTPADHRAALVMGIRQIMAASALPREEPQPANDYDALHDAATDRAEVERVAGYPGVSWAGRGAGPGKYVLISETERDALVRCARYWLDRPLEEPQPAPSEALEALKRFLAVAQGRRQQEYESSLADYHTIGRALSGLPQEPTPPLWSDRAIEAALLMGPQTDDDEDCPPGCTISVLDSTEAREMLDAAYRAQFASPPSPPKER